MSESQNNNQDPNNVDEEQDSAASSGPQDVSGTFQLAQNPDQFFQGSISANDGEGSMQTRSFSFASSQFNPDPSAPVFNPNVLPEPSAAYIPGTSASYEQSAAVYNPEPAASHNPSEPFTPESSANNAGMASHPDSSGAFNPDPAAEFQGQDFFDGSGRQIQNPQSFASQPQVFHQADPAQVEPAAIPQVNKLPTRPPSPDSSRLGGGFFDVQENANAGSASTTGGAPQNPAGASPPLPQKYNQAVSAQQAFFAGNEVPQLPTPTQQTNSAFQDFYQDPSPAGRQFPEGIQPPGPGQMQNPGQNQPAPFSQQQPNPSNQPLLQQQPAQPAQSPQPNQNFQTQQPPVSNPASQPHPGTNPNLTPEGQSGSNATTPSTPPRNENKENQSDSESAPTVKRKRRRRRLEDEEPVNDFTQAEEQMDSFKRFERLVVNPETKGLTMMAFQEARQVLTQPEQFFKSMSARGNIAEPAIFVFILAGVSGLLAGVISMNLLITLQFMIGNILQVYLLSFICWKMYTGMGSTEPFETTFRVIAYSQATLIVAGLKFSIFGNWIPAYITLLIATIWALRVQITGMKHVHDMPSNKAMPVLVLATLFILLIRFKIFLL